MAFIDRRWTSAATYARSVPAHTFMEASMSTVPTRRSSVTPSGICTKGAARTLVGGGPAPIFSLRPSCTCNATSM